MRIVTTALVVVIVALLTSANLAMAGDHSEDEGVGILPPIDSAPPEMTVAQASEAPRSIDSEQTGAEDAVSENDDSDDSDD